MFFPGLMSFLIKATLVLGSALVVRGFFRERIPASIRFWLIFGAIAVLPLLAAMPAFDSVPRGDHGLRGQGIADSAQLLDEGFIFSSSQLRQKSSGAILVPEALARSVESVWILVALALMGKTLFVRATSSRALSRLEPCGDCEWLEAFERARVHHGIECRVRLYSYASRSPFVTGPLGRSIVVPIADGIWTRERREAVMLHEVGHIKRNDILLMALVELIAATVWCIPFVPFLLKALVEDREEACDAFAITGGVRPSDYASLLLDLASTGPAPSLPGAQGIVDGKRLGRRIGSIISGGEALMTGGKLPAILLGLLVMASAAVPSVFAVSGPNPGTVITLRYITEAGTLMTGSFDTRSLPTGIPLDGLWRVSMAFGEVPNPQTGKKYLHTGIDLSDEKAGDRVKATMAGIVVDAGFSQARGNYVVIGAGETTTCFYHLDTIRVAKDDRVEKGAVIGTVGSSGTSTGPHLHYEIRIRQTAVDPAAIWKARDSF